MALFGKKIGIEPEAAGRLAGENALTYTEPCGQALLAIRKQAIGHSLSSEQELSLSYAMMLNTAAAVCELALHDLRSLKFNRGQFRLGFLNYFDAFAEVYQQELNIPITNTTVVVAACVESEIDSNPIYALTGTYYGSGSKNSIYHNVVRYVARYSFPESERDIVDESVRNPSSWHTVLNAIQGIDVSYKWVTRSVPFNRIRRS